MLLHKIIVLKIKNINLKLSKKTKTKKGKKAFDHQLNPKNIYQTPKKS